MLTERRKKMRKRRPSKAQAEPTKDLLLRGENFVSKKGNTSFELRPLECEASALTAELTARNYIYFKPQQPHL
jgi:hypothetical protein